MAEWHRTPFVVSLAYLLMDHSKHILSQFAKFQSIRPFMVGWLVLLAAPGWTEFALAQGDAGQLLIQAARAESKEALALLAKAVPLLAEGKGLIAMERQELTGQLALVLMERKTSPDEIASLLGAKARKQVARQVFYRRYLEHWLFESPVRLWVTLDCRRGQDPNIRAIQVLPPEN